MIKAWVPQKLPPVIIHFDISNELQEFYALELATASSDFLGVPPWKRPWGYPVDLRHRTLFSFTKISYDGKLSARLCGNEAKLAAALLVVQPMALVSTQKGPLGSRKKHEMMGSGCGIPSAGSQVHPIIKSTAAQNRPKN